MSKHENYVIQFIVELPEMEWAATPWRLSAFTETTKWRKPEGRDGRLSKRRQESVRPYNEGQRPNKKSTVIFNRAFRKSNNSLRIGLVLRHFLRSFFLFLFFYSGKYNFH